MANKPPTKVTSPSAAKSAAKTLSSPHVGKTSKAAAGSALSQVNSRKVTSPSAASAASKTLRDGRTASTSKSAAGSALSQMPAKKAAPAKKASSTGAGTSSGGPRKPKA